MAASGIARIISSVFSTATCAGCDLRVCSPPVPVTTTSLSVSAASEIWKSVTAVCPAVTETCFETTPYPIIWTRSVCVPTGTPVIV